MKLQQIIRSLRLEGKLNIPCDAVAVTQDREGHLRYWKFKDVTPDRFGGKHHTGRGLCDHNWKQNLYGHLVAEDQSTAVVHLDSLDLVGDTDTSHLELRIQQLEERCAILEKKLFLMGTVAVQQ